VSGLWGNIGKGGVGGLSWLFFVRAGSFYAGVFGGVLQTISGMLKTCLKLFVARWTGFCSAFLQFSVSSVGAVVF